MSESNRPFTEQVTRANRVQGGTRVARLGWILAGLLTMGLIAALLCWAIAVGKLRSMERLQSDLQDANASLAKAMLESSHEKEEIAALQNQLADLQKEKESVAQSARGLEDEMRADLESKDVTISKLQGKLTVNILDRVMFDSGESVLKPGGEAVMRKIAELLAAHPTLKIHVIGHTDNVPIHGKFPSNWELSAARALAAVHFLTEKAGVDPRRVGAVGYGEYRPIADNATAEGRAKNRRIAITILPDELAAADTAAPEKAAASTNETSSPPVPAPLAPPSSALPDVPIPVPLPTQK